MNRHPGHVDGCPIPEGAAAVDEPAADGKGLDAFFCQVAGKAVNNYVHTVAIGEASHFLLDGGGGVVDAFVGAELSGLFQFGVGACAGDDPSVEELGNLDACNANATAGRIDQNDITRLNSGPGHEHVPDGHEYDGQGGSVDEGHVVGDGDDAVPRG